MLLRGTRMFSCSQAARKATEAIVAGPLRFIPVEIGQGRRYRIEGPMANGEMAVTESS